MAARETMASRLSRKGAEEACRRAEELFVAGDVHAAYRHAREAQWLFPSLPGLASTLAAYAIHATAAASPDCPDWHAVLGVSECQVSELLDAAISEQGEQDAIKKLYRRMSLLVHPDKNPTPAADGAFKLLCQACDALSATAKERWPTPTAAAAPSTGSREYRTQICCNSCGRSFTKPVGFVDGSRCPWCGRRLTLVPPWMRGKKG